MSKKKKSLISLVLIYIISIGSGYCLDYEDFYQYLLWDEIVENPRGGGGSVIISLKDNTLNVKFSAGFSSSRLKYGNIVKLETSPQLPDLFLGKMEKGYEAYIKSGYLWLAGPPLEISTVTLNYTKVLSTFELSKTENYVATYTPQEELKDISKFPIESKERVQKSIQYFDGLGRLKQSVQIQGSYSGKDIVTPSEYDAYGRQAKAYLPYVANQTSGAYVESATQGQRNFYSSATQLRTSLNEHIVPDPTPYSFTQFENSPLNRVEVNTGPGTEWHKGKHGQNFAYETNKQGEVIRWTISNSGKLERREDYKASTLYKNVVYDENNAVGSNSYTVEFKDTFDKVILKRTVVDGKKHDTYYVYDEFNLLRFVIPPKAVDQLSDKIPPMWEMHAMFVQTPIKIGKRPEYVRTYTTEYYIDGDGSVTLTDGFEFKASKGQSFTITSGSSINGLCYQYKYDGHKRMIEKKLPGAQPVYMVYDDRDRLVATQDGNQRAGGKTEWTFTKYDALNRPIATGIVSKQNRTVIENELKTCSKFETIIELNNPNSHGYTNSSWPKNVSYQSFLDVTYYDDYKNLPWANHCTLGYEIAEGYTKNDKTCYNSKVKGQIVGRRTQVLDEKARTADALFVESEIYYDKKYRVIKTIEILYPECSWQNDVLVVSSRYDFVGKVDETNTCLIKAGKEAYRIDEGFEYDHAGRLLSAKHNVNGKGWKTVSNNKYNELGQLTQKKVGGSSETACANFMNYQYNIRGWLTQINDPSQVVTKAGARNKQLFNMKLLYNKGLEGLDSPKQWNGNISSVTWRTPSDTKMYNNGNERAYGFTYDGMNRLKAAHYGEKNKDSNYSQPAKHHNVSITRFDKNGNIEGIKRYRAGTLVDNLSMKYQNNQLIQSDDAANNAFGFNDQGVKMVGEYRYDANGNMIADKNKGITSITYNPLNLPSLISGGNKTIRYIYDASGRKLAKVADNPTTGKKATYYQGNFVYKDAALDYILFSEGLIYSNGTNYNYQLKDHLGNVRMVVDADGNIQQQTDYYPFGLELASNGTSDNQYKYNGKEAQEDGIGNGTLDWLDYGARMYDPALGRWHVVDPLAENAYKLTPYRYGLNNPISFIDPDGMEEDWVERDGEVVYDEKVTSENDEDLKEGDEYIGEQGLGVDENTGEVIHYNDDGSKSRSSGFMLGEVTATQSTGYPSENPSLSPYNQTGYVWDKQDLKVYNAIKDLDNPITTYLNLSIQKGRFEPLTLPNYYDTYGHKAGVLMLFFDYFNMMAASTNPSPGINQVKYKNLSLRGAPQKVVKPPKVKSLKRLRSSKRSKRLKRKRRKRKY